MSPYGSGAPLVFDTSAFARLPDRTVAARWTVTLEAGLLALCPVVALELLGASRNEDEFARLDRALSGLTLRAPVTEGVSAAAIGASRELRGSRRLPAADYLIAAAAATQGFAVLHDDAHFDVLAGVLGFESVHVTSG